MKQPSSIFLIVAFLGALLFWATCGHDFGWRSDSELAGFDSMETAPLAARVIISFTIGLLPGILRSGHSIDTHHLQIIFSETELPKLISTPALHDLPKPNCT